MPAAMINAVTWLKNDYTEDGLWYKQTGIQDNISEEQSKNTTWYKSTMNELIGFPLQMASPSPLIRTDNRSPREREWNQLINYLHIRIDTEDPTKFGLPDASFQGTAWMGSVCITRQDKGPLHVKHIEMLYEFTRKHREVIYFQKDKHTFEDPLYSIKQIQTCFTPNVFAQFCVKYSREKMEAGETAWKEIECSVINVCGSCIAARQSDGRELLFSSGCKYRQYCSNECQKSDWKRHKVTCPSVKRKAEQMTSG